MQNDDNQTKVQNPMLTAALSYADQGWPIVPLYSVKDGACTCYNKEKCESPGKHPILENGVRGASTDKEQITGWFDQWPDANLGIATGEKSFDVLDVDLKGDGPSALKELEAEYGPLPETPCQITGSGGKQYFFKYTGKFGNLVRFLPGMDTRSDAGFVVVPPSKHYSGGTYQWETGKSVFDLPLAEMPEWLINFAQAKKAKKASIPVEVEITQGNRNDNLFALGCSLRAKGMEIDEIRPALEMVNKNRCKPPVAQNELERVLKSIENYPKGEMIARGFSGGKLEINARNQDVQAVSNEAWQSLMMNNDPPWLFRQAGRMVHLVEDEGVVSLRGVDDSFLRFCLARSANWYKMEKEEKIRALPPAFVVADMMAAPNPPLPKLDRLIEYPSFAPDGTIHLKKGYSKSTRCLTTLSEGLVIPDVPSSPSPEDVVKACQYIDELFCDFPFVGDSERAMAFSLLILPFARELISGQVPIYLIEAPTQGTGKSLLAGVAAYPALGRQIPVMSGTKNQDELKKLITSVLNDLPSFVLLDNLSGTLDSNQLAAALTSSEWKDRVLGETRTITLPAKCIWIITANNLMLSTELARRSVRIRMDAKMDLPWRRDQSKFRHPDIFEWAGRRRGELIWAALILVQNWLSRGRPLPVNIKPIGGFLPYCHTMGGILQSAGIEGFLSNMEDFYEASDVESGNLRVFVDAWLKAFGSRVVGSSELFELINKEDLPIDLGNRSDKGQRTKLGSILAALKDRMFGNYKVVLSGSKKNAKQWQLVVVNSVVVNLNQGSPEVNHEVNPDKQLNTLDKHNIGEPGEPISNLTEKILIFDGLRESIEKEACDQNISPTRFEVNQVNPSQKKQQFLQVNRSLSTGEPIGEPQIKGSPEVNQTTKYEPSSDQSQSPKDTFSWLEALAEIES